MINWRCCLAAAGAGASHACNTGPATADLAGDLDSYPVDPESCGNFFIGSDINFLN